MNRDRRVIVKALADIVKAYTAERDMPYKVLMVIRDNVKALAVTEERSIAKMEKFKDNETTARNYHNSVAAYDDLMLALDCLEEGEVADALPYLVRVADPEAAERQERRVVTKKPAVKRQRKKAS